MDQAESERLFQLTGTDSLRWLSIARSLKYSAEVLRDRLIESMKIPAMFRQTETEGLLMSSMLLLGLAIENLVKGVYVAKNPEVVDERKIDSSGWKTDGGHGIADFVKAFISVDQEEEELLVRLQEYIIWAGRYPIPNKSTRFYNSRYPVNKRYLNTRDFRIVDGLFDKLTEVLHNARKASA